MGQKHSEAIETALANLHKKAADERAGQKESPEGKKKFLEKFRSNTLVELREVYDSVVTRTEWTNGQGQVQRVVAHGIDGTPRPSGAVVMTNHRSRKERAEKLREFILSLEVMVEFIRLKKVDRLPKDLEGYLEAMYAKIPDRNEMLLVGKPKSKK